MYVIFTSFQLKIIYMGTTIYCTFQQLVGKALIEIEFAVAKQTKNVLFCFFQNILSAAIFYHRRRDI